MRERQSMTNDTPVPPPVAVEHDPVQDAIDLVQMVGQSLNIAMLYGLTHKVTHASIERSFPVLALFMERHGPLHVGVVEGELLLNGTSSNGAPLAGNLVSRLTSLNLLSLVIEPDLSLEEYRNLLTLLMTPPGKAGSSGSATDLVSAHGFQHIQAQNVAYRRVTETDAAPSDTAEPTPHPERAPNIEKVLAFLKAPPEAGSESAREDLVRLASDAEQLADLILRTADVREQAIDPSSGESMTDLVVGCINRIANTLLESPASKSQKGRKQVKRTLLLLEKSLVARLRNLASDSVDPAAVSSAITETAEDLDMEALAAKYMKTRRTAEKAEAQLRRLIQRSESGTDQELRDSLMTQGLTAEGWRELVVNQRATPPSAAGQDAQLQDIKALTLLLARLGETLQQTQAEPAGATDAKLLSLVSETRQQVTAVTAGTEQKIATLQAMADADVDQEVSDKPLRLSHKALLRTLAEIAQELSQPLTVISATLDMLRGQRTGPITAAQGELLALAAESSARLGRLVSCLMRLSGPPESLKPDRSVFGLASPSAGLSA